MKVKVVEVCSGFSNIPNSLILEEDYKTSAAPNRPGSCHDNLFTVLIPEDCKIHTTSAGEHVIFKGEEEIVLGYIDSEKSQIIGYGRSGIYSFPISEAL